MCVCNGDEALDNNVRQTRNILAIKEILVQVIPESYSLENLIAHRI